MLLTIRMLGSFITFVQVLPDQRVVKQNSANMMRLTGILCTLKDGFSFLKRKCRTLKSLKKLKDIESVSRKGSHVEAKYKIGYHPERALPDELRTNIAREPEQSTASGVVLLSFHGRVFHHFVAIPTRRQRAHRPPFPDNASPVSTAGDVPRSRPQEWLSEGLPARDRARCQQGHGTSPPTR